jgi:Beta-propeller repeat
MKLKECFCLFFSLLLFQLPIAGCRLSIGKDVSHKSSITNRQSTIQPASAAKATSPVTPGPGLASQTRLSVSEAYGKLSLSFEANRGQADRRVKFLSRGKGYSLFLTATEAVLQLSIADRRLSIEGSGEPDQHQPHHYRAREQAASTRKSSIDNRQSSILRMKLLGANPHSQIEAFDPLPGKSNYFVGSDPAKWRTAIPTYARVKYQDIYPGVDLVYYGNQGRLEYDMVLSPGADPDGIRLSYQGADKIKIDETGDLLIGTAGAELRQHKPVIYQETDGSRQTVAGKYVLTGRNEVGFQLDAHDPAKPVIIDPVLEYSTFLGGNGGDNPSAIAVDGAGSAYVTGVTTSSDFPTTAGSFRPTKVAQEDAFVVKLDPTGASVIYSTYLGGFDDDAATSIAVDGAGNAYVAGSTFAPNFPTVNALQAASAGKGDGFVSKLNPSGSSLLYSSYLGGSDDDAVAAIGLDASGLIYLMGVTKSNNFPVVNPLQLALSGPSDLFLAKLNTAGSTLAYSTYLGGSGDEFGIGGLAVDASGNAYVTGGTASIDFPTKNPVQAAKASTFPWGFDAFLAKLNSSGNALAYSTYLGGTGDEIGWSVVVNSAGEAYVTGGTGSADFPTANALQPAFGGVDFDAFVAKFNSNGSSLIFSTYLGGRDSDEGHGVAIDSSGNVYVTGFTRSSNFPTVNPVQPVPSGNLDVFVTKLLPAGSNIVYSTFLGGSDFDGGRAIAVDGPGNAYVTGATFSTNFPTAHPFQASKAADTDSFILKISENPALSDSTTLFVPIVVSVGGLNNSFFTSELVLTNRGTKDATLEFTYTSGIGSGTGTATDTLGAGQQWVLHDAIDYLRSIGMPIPTSGNQGGTLAIHFSGLSSATDAGVTVRTTTVVAEGRAGLAYAGIPRWSVLTEPVYLCGLRQNENTDRSNVAIQNMGTAADGDIVLRLTAFSGNSTVPSSPHVLPDETLSPGALKQISGVLHSNGISLDNGYVRIERISGTAPYYAYAVINDQHNSDGSFVTPIRDSSMDPEMSAGRLTLPVIVETGPFTSELVLTNWSTNHSQLFFEFVAGAIEGSGSAQFEVDLQPGEQRIIPDLIQYLRGQGTPGIGPAGSSYAGALIVSGDTRGIFLGARASAPGGGGRYGLFYQAVPRYAASTKSAWLYGLQQDNENRTNLAIVNTGETDHSSDTFQIELFDGSTGRKVNTVRGIALEAKQWFQIDAILTKYAPGLTQGYARVTRTSGSNPFITYAVINDGGVPGDRTGDGAFAVSSP